MNQAVEGGQPLLQCFASYHQNENLPFDTVMFSQESPVDLQGSLPLKLGGTGGKGNQGPDRQ